MASSTTTTTSAVQPQPTKKFIVGWDLADWASVGLVLGIGASLLIILIMSVLGLYYLVATIPRVMLGIVAAGLLVWAWRGCRSFIGCWSTPRGRHLARIRVMAVVGTIVIGVLGTMLYPAQGHVVLWVVVGCLLIDRLCGARGIAEVEARLKKEAALQANNAGTPLTPT